MQNSGMALTFRPKTIFNLHLRQIQFDSSCLSIHIPISSHLMDSGIVKQTSIIIQQESQCLPQKFFADA